MSKSLESAYYVGADDIAAAAREVALTGGRAWHIASRLVDPREHYRRLKTEVDAAVTETLAKGDLVLREQLASFERHLAAFVGTAFAVGVNSGVSRAALLLARGRDRSGRRGHHRGAHVRRQRVRDRPRRRNPVLIDVGPDYDMDVAGLERAITPRTRAIMPVHLNGRVCDMGRIMTLARTHGLAVIEDAAQALGARFDDRMAGGFGVAGCFSFYPLKALGGLGDGGAVTTNDPEMARRVTLLRFNGEDRETGEFHLHGYTALLDNVNAAVLDVKLRHLPAWIDHRRHIAALYRRALTGVGDLRLPHFPDTRHFDSFQNYVIRTGRRDALRAFLRPRASRRSCTGPSRCGSTRGSA